MMDFFVVILIVLVAAWAFVVILIVFVAAWAFITDDDYDHTGRMNHIGGRDGE